MNLKTAALLAFAGTLILLVNYFYKFFSTIVVMLSQTEGMNLNYLFSMLLDIFAWIFISLFFITYYIKKKKRRSHK